MTFSIRSVLFAPLALALLAACGDTPVAPDGGAAVDADSPIDAQTSDDAASAGDARAPDSGTRACDYVATIDRSCTADDDCLVRLHQSDCCGSSIMIGIHTSAESTYLAAEPACQASYPTCGCPAMLPTTDSGETVADTSTVRAGCIARATGDVCMTYVTMRPADGA
ncbi:MAG: hypothetical protein M3Y87_05275 [Myxococcota bacterium]|nr:hypothetical protein [Myxococcota bacterium]